MDKDDENALFTKGGRFKTRFKCHYCQETGHFIKDCERKKEEEKVKKM